MYEDKSAVKNIGEYDDYAPAETEEVDTEGLLSPFTFLCFAVILVLFGAVTLLSASYDTALRADTAFYSPFIKEIGALFIGLVIGSAVCFVPLKYLRRFHFLLLPLYLVLSSVALFVRSCTPSFLYTSITGMTGMLTLLFLFSDIVPRISSREKGGAALILTVAVTLLVLVTVTLVSGPAWYILGFIVITASLVSLKTKRSFIIYFTIAAVVILAFLILTQKKLLSSVIASSFPIPDSPYYSSRLYESEKAISEGGFIGVGIGNGLYKLGVIDDIEGEFVYASMSEETGMVGTLIILFSLLMIMIICIRTSSRAWRKGEMFISSFSLAGSSLFSFGILLNMFYISGLLPFEGLPLLLFSYNPVNEAFTVVLLCLLYKFIFRMGREKD